MARSWYNTPHRNQGIIMTPNTQSPQVAARNTSSSPNKPKIKAIFFDLDEGYAEEMSASIGAQYGAGSEFFAAVSTGAHIALDLSQAHVHKEYRPDLVYPYIVYDGWASLWKDSNITVKLRAKDRLTFELEIVSLTDGFSYAELIAVSYIVTREVLAVARDIVSSYAHVNTTIWGLGSVTD